jgi:pimeloyl-ACP methyl ester carboxylesterase
MGRIGAAVALAGAATRLTSAASAQSARRTFVLIHGGLHGGWVWRRVSDRLEAKGHKVFAPTLTGLGERSHLLSKDINLDMHVSDIVNLIKWEELTDCCVVTASYGGFPASGALEQIGDRVSSIVWLDAQKPENGQTVLDLVGSGFRERITNAISKGEISFPPVKPGPIFVNEKDADFVLSKATPHPINTLVQPINLSGARERIAKKTFIRVPKYPDPSLIKTFAECKTDKSWSTFELADSGHLAMLDAPERVTDLLLQAA